MVGVLGVAGSPALASSHREAPLISQDPIADNTDVYAFKDPNDPKMVDIIANYIGLEDPAGGPNFTRFGDDVMYEIHINNTGDATDQITYQFRFKTVTANGGTFLYNTGPVKSLNDPNLNVKQFMTVRKIDKSGSSIVANSVPVAPANVGRRSMGTTTDYDNNLGLPAVAGLTSGGQVFAGPRKDPFFVDLGSVFDLLGLRPLNGAHLIPLNGAQAGVDQPLAQKNVHEIALRLPISSVSKNGNVPTTVDDPASVIGVYASASRQRVKILSTVGGAPRNAGQWIQVSRLGIPLVNEVLIPLGDKDRWNARTPAHDLDKDGFGSNILDPEPAKLIPVLYPGVMTPPAPRTSDILPIVQGAGAGLSKANYLPPADLLRVNLATPITASPSRLGILAGDAQGFPNGRRLNDDVVDIELRLLAGGTPFTPAYNKSPNNALTDGVDAPSVQPIGVFPYEAPPIGGYDETPPTGQTNP
ncbi:MAG: DUF4331 domain-containing protein [Acidimicrobiales bacterium]